MNKVLTKEDEEIFVNWLLTPNEERPPLSIQAPLKYLFKNTSIGTTTGLLQDLRQAFITVNSVRKSIGLNSLDKSYRRFLLNKSSVFTENPFIIPCFKPKTPSNAVSLKFNYWDYLFSHSIKKSQNIKEISDIAFSNMLSSINFYPISDVLICIDEEDYLNNVIKLASFEERSPLEYPFKHIVYSPSYYTALTSNYESLLNIDAFMPIFCKTSPIKFYFSEVDSWEQKGRDMYIPDEWYYTQMEDILTNRTSLPCLIPKVLYIGEGDYAPNFPQRGYLRESSYEKVKDSDYFKYLEFYFSQLYIIKGI